MALNRIETDAQCFSVFLLIIGLANNEYGILTTYVPDFEQLHLNLNGRYEVRQ